MRKGKLEKTENLLKHSIDWDRHSESARSDRWVDVSAYLNAHNGETYVGRVEGFLLPERWNYRHGLDIKFGFESIEDAFNWADNRVDYKNEKLKEIDDND